MSSIRDYINKMGFVSECLTLLEFLLKDKCENCGTNDTIKYMLEKDISKGTIHNLGFVMHEIEDVSERVYGDE